MLCQNLNYKYLCFFSSFLTLVIFIIYIYQYDLIGSRSFNKDFFYIINTLTKSKHKNNTKLCNPFNENYVQFTVNIDNQTYPKYLNLNENKSINFDCLNQDDDLKIILLWTPFFGNSDYYYGLGAIEPFKKNDCPVTNCELTDDKERLKESDFVITHMRDSLKDLPLDKPHYPRWIFMLYESPANSPDFSHLKKFYNLTSTYKINSDFPNFYEAGF